MPTVLRVGGYRFHFYSDEGVEPAHIHCRCEGKECKFWLEPVRLAGNRGIAPNRIREIERIVHLHHSLLVEKFHEHRSRQT
ncbi:MAG: DUF4160 domain-containing protein [Opitutales bacterium]